jgi:arylsulfatase A-like enzyme
MWNRFVAALAVALAASVAHAQTRDERPPRNIILIGWDGAQREHVRECLRQGELPTLRSLATEGKLVDIDIRGTTDTKAGWSQILTGYDPKVTGVYSNAKYQTVPAGLSIFERLKEHFGADKFAALAVIGKKSHCGEIDPPKKVRLTDEEAARIENAKTAKKTPPRNRRQRDKLDDQETAAPQAARKGRLKPEPGSRIVVEDGVKYLVTPGKPYANMAKACDVWEFGLMADEKVGTRALELLDKYKDKPFFLFVHFAEVDHKGHRSGENSKQYNEALISNDAWTGRIIAKLKELKLYDDTLIYVTADHGFNEGATNHSNAPRVFLATNDTTVMRDGDRADVAPTILARFGLDLENLTQKAITTTRPGVKDPPLAGRPLTRALTAEERRQRETRPTTRPRQRRPAA